MAKIHYAIAAGLMLAGVSAFAQDRTINVNVTDVNTTHDISMILPRSSDFLFSKVGSGVSLSGAFQKGNVDTTGVGHKFLTGSFTIDQDQGQYTQFFFNLKRADLWGTGCAVKISAMQDGTLTATPGNEPTCKYTHVTTSGDNVDVIFLDQNVGATKK